MKKSKIKLGLMALLGFVANAQQDAQYTQYMYNTMNINPAYAGSRGNLSIFGVHRSQWVGMEGAPSTTALSVNTPIQDTKIGLGLTFLNDNLGATSQNTISADVSYTIDLGGRSNHKLSFGLKGTVNLLDIDYDKLRKLHISDYGITGDISETSPNFGAGVYYHTENAYLGVSVPDILNQTAYTDKVIEKYKEIAHFNFIGGYVFDINPELKFKPAFLIKAAKGAPFQGDITGNFLIMDKLTLGGAYRFGAAWSALAGYQITDGLFIGYSYDNDVKALGTYNNGSHEIFIRFDLFGKYDRINSPRFF